MTLRKIIPILAAAILIPGTARPADVSGENGSDKFGLHLGSLRLDASSIFESNIDHEVVSREDYGMDVGGRIRVQSHRRRPLLRLEYRGGVESYANSNRWDRVAHRMRGTLESTLTRGLSAEVYGEFNRRTSSEDRELVNQRTVSPELTLSGSGSRRLRVYGAFRSRRYVDTPDRDENIWYAGLSARKEIWEDADLEAGYRYESCDSQDPEESYIRHRVELELEQEIGRTSIRAGVQYRTREYSGDMVDSGGTPVPREDTRWIPSLRVTHDLRRGPQLYLDYEYQTRNSNDPDKGFDAHRIALALRWTLIRS